MNQWSDYILEPKDMFEDGQRGVSESTFNATEVQREVQFLDEVNSFFEDRKYFCWWLGWCTGAYWLKKNALKAHILIVMQNILKYNFITLKLLLINGPNREFQGDC